MHDSTFAGAFQAFAASKFEDYQGQVRRCVGLLSEKQLWYRANKHSNSIANLLLHLRGNLNQWVLGGLGGLRIERDRQGEFDASGPMPRDQILPPLEETVRQACETIRSLSPQALLRTYVIQDYQVTGLEAVFHVVEHFAFHTGQIITTTKWLLDVDLSLYDEKGHRQDGSVAGAP